MLSQTIVILAAVLFGITAVIGAAMFIAKAIKQRREAKKAKSMVIDALNEMDFASFLDNCGNQKTLDDLNKLVK